jgi:ATP-dependent DNA helicase RecQ
MLDYAATGGCRMEYLRRELDDPKAAPCGRCDNCTGRHWPVDAPERTTQAAQARLQRPGVEIEPRKMWPSGMKDLNVAGASGKIRPELLAEPGRALGRLTDIGWGTTLRGLLADTAPDEPVTDQVVDAVVKVLTAWDWRQRPAGVVTLPSGRRPMLIASLGQRIASVGRLPYLGSLEYTVPDGPGPRRHNSAQRLAALWSSLAVPDRVRDALADRAQGPVLLVDDRVETGWTMTVAAKLLREAGAPAVLPLTLSVATG